MYKKSRFLITLSATYSKNSDFLSQHPAERLLQHLLSNC